MENKCWQFSELDAFSVEGLPEEEQNVELVSKKEKNISILKFKL